MSTFHNLDSSIGIEENSNKLTLVYDTHDQYLEVTHVKSPEDMLKLLLIGIKVCSYNMDSKEFKKVINDNFEDWSV